MTFQQKPGTGALFPNDRKEKDSHPDYRGDINIDGKNYWIAAWVKEGKRGKFFSISVDEKKAPDVSSQVDGKPRTKGDEYRASKEGDHRRGMQNVKEALGDWQEDDLNDLPF